MTRLWLVSWVVMKQNDNGVGARSASFFQVGTEEYALGCGHKHIDKEFPQENGWTQRSVLVSPIPKAGLLKLLEMVDE